MKGNVSAEQTSSTASVNTFLLIFRGSSASAVPPHIGSSTVGMAMRRQENCNRESSQRKWIQGNRFVPIHKENIAPAVKKRMNLIFSRLSRSVKKGSADTVKALERECVSAFEARKRLAREQGDKASLKLLLPMGMLLMVVLAIMMIPAFLTM